ncbi:MAG TPA: BON domain-containing protein [Casimicrobiaceae bacterium]
MNVKLATAVFVAGAMLVPAAAWAAGSPGAPGAPAAPAQESGSMMNKTKGAVNDTAITAKVKAKLASDRDMHGNEITVSTDHGTVNLGGTAKSEQDAQKATELAKATEGVASVNNDIKVEAGGAMGGATGGANGGAKY